MLSWVSWKIPVGTVPLKLLCLRSLQDSRALGAMGHAAWRLLGGAPGGRAAHKASVSVLLSCASSGGIVPVKDLLYRSSDAPL